MYMEYGINSYIVGCKLIKEKLNINAIGINSYIVGCKSTYQRCHYHYSSELIVT